jgi:hypothetical protein
MLQQPATMPQPSAGHKRNHRNRCLEGTVVVAQVFSAGASKHPGTSFADRAPAAPLAPRPWQQERSWSCAGCLPGVTNEPGSRQPGSRRRVLRASRTWAASIMRTASYRAVNVWTLPTQLAWHQLDADS